MSTVDLKGDSLIIGAPIVRAGFEEFYDFTMKEVTSLKEIGMAPFSSYYLKLSGNDIFNGELLHPIPVAFVHLDMTGEIPLRISDVFFLEAGDHTITLPKLEHKQEVELSSPVNREYQKLRNFLKPVYTKAANPFQVDSLLDFSLKQKLLAEYIKQNPDSYPAFWEIVNDYSFYRESEMNFDILNAFSDEFKRTLIYRQLKTKIEIENSTQEGNSFPEVRLEPAFTLESSFFNRNRITLIDYWSTTCGPCIASMPKLVELHALYKEKGLHIVGLADDKTAAAKERAGKLLAKNHATWDNYFDDDDEFKTKVNANGYPLYFLVDRKSIILYRGNDLDKVREVISETIN